MAKNILFITNLHLWSLEKGKGGRAFINTVEGYLNQGWNVWMVSTGGSVPSGLIKNGQLHEESFPKLDRWYKSGNRILSVFSRFLKQFLIRRFYIRKGETILNQHSEDSFIVYSYEVHGVSAGRYLANKYNLPFVTRFQGTVHSATPNTFFDRIKSSPHLCAYGTPADITIMTNDGTKGAEVLRRFNNTSKKTLFWRNGVNKVPMSLISQRSELRDRFNFDKDFIFLTVSRLVNWKKVDRAIEGFSIFQKNHPNSKLVIIGDGVELTNLKALSSSKSLDDKIEFLGSKPQNEIYNYMVAADVFMSLYDLSNVGNPLMEAMMCGKPIITLDVGDTRELIKDKVNGVLLTTDTLNELPVVMSELYENKEFRDRISANSFAYANEYFWNWDERINAEILEVEKLVYRG